MMFYLKYRPYIAIIIFFILPSNHGRVVNVEWHGQDYLHLKWHVVCSGLANPDLWNETRETYYREKHM